MAEVKGSAIGSGTGYEVHGSHGGDFWINHTVGKNAADTPEQAKALIKGLKQNSYFGRQFRVVKVVHEVIYEE